MVPRALLVLSLAALLAAEERPPDPILIDLTASRGKVIPQSLGGGGFQRSLRFSALPGSANHWIRQELAVRGTVLDEEGALAPVHLNVIEYYRLDSKGRAIQQDSHYSQFWEHRGGDLTIQSKLTYGELQSKRLGDTILAKSFILRSCTDAAGERVLMKTRRTRQVIPAEYGERVEFKLDPGSIPTHYRYGVTWDVRAGVGSRTQPSGEIEVGIWWREVREEAGGTGEGVRG